MTDMTEDAGGNAGKGRGGGKDEAYFFFVNRERYETAERYLTAAQIKAMVPNVETGDKLSLEGKGDDPDRLLADDERVDLDKDHGPRRFTIVPAANFGDSARPLSVLDFQFAELRDRYPGAMLREEAGTKVVSVPIDRIALGWSKEAVTVHFLVPPGYPHANPDCFNTDADLVLARGSAPRASAQQVMPIVGSTLWFSWHLQRGWKPGEDSLLSWVGTILARFENAE